jgi:HD domain-containing protein
MTRLGTLSWIDRTGGRLAWHERLALLAQVVRARAAAAIRRRSARKVRLLEVDEILPPDSAITREALALSQDSSRPFLFNHCVRSYFWARLLDEDGQPFDDEAVFTALMLHDMGLTEQGRRAANQKHCFTQVGADMVCELARKHGWSDRRSTLTANAITLHLNVLIADRHGKEARMVRAGSGADVAGLGLHALGRDQIDEVVSRIPRLKLKREMIATLDVESRARPDGRTAFLCNQLDFGRMIEGSRVFSE